jgi:integrase
MIATLKIFCQWAFKKRHTSATGWLDLKKIEEKEQTIITLEDHELRRYYNFDFGKKVNLARGRDVFCFAAFCGLRYSDLIDLDSHSVKRGKLNLNTNKTSKDLSIKLIPEALDILAKYDYKLPLDISNQKLNNNIKAGVKKAGINRMETVIVQYLSDVKKERKYVHELISIHDARKTFITLCLDNGLSIPQVMKMSTHDSYSSFKRYMNMDQGKVDEKLPEVFGNLTVVA